MLSIKAKFQKHSGSNGKTFQSQGLICNLIAHLNQKSNKMYVIALPILCDNFNKEIETSSKSEINFDFVAIGAVLLTEFKTILSLEMLMPF